MLDIMDLDNETSAEDTTESEILDTTDDTTDASQDAAGDDDVADDTGEASADDTAADPYTRLIRQLDVPEKANAKLLESLTEEHINSLGDTGRTLLAQLIAHQNAITAAEKARANSRYNEADQRIKAAQEAERRALQEKAKLGQILNSQALKDQLERAAKIDPSKLDLFTPEGQRAYLDKQAADHAKSFFAPVTDAARQAEAELNYRDFCEQNPRMKDPAFKREVASYLKSAAERKEPVSLATAYQILADREVAEKARQQSEARRRARATAAQHTAKTTSPGRKPTAGIPENIEKDGYRTKDGVVLKGIKATIAYYREHPEANARDYRANTGQH
jgi:hypothetical protein